MFRRIKAERKSLGGLVSKRKRGSDIDSDEEEETETESKPDSKKRSTSNITGQGCRCTTGSKT